MAHCVSQIATAFQKNGNIRLALAFQLQKVAKLNLEGLIQFEVKKPVHRMQLHLFPEQLHNSSLRHYDQPKLSNNQCF